MNNTVVFISREFPIKHRDLLLSKFIDDSQKQHFILWDRKKRANDSNIKSNFHVFKREIKSMRSIKFLISLIGFIKYANSVINELKPSTIIISHYTLYVPYFLLSKRNKQYKVVIDVHDLPSTESKGIFKFLLAIEKMIIPKSVETILASRYFSRFYNRGQVLDNFPRLNNSEISNTNLEKTKDGIIRVGFVGAIRYEDLYLNLIASLENQFKVEFHFYGTGPAEEKLKKSSINNSNIYFHGYFDKNEIPLIYSKIDVVWACYPSKNYNVKYATSNKAIESLYYNTPAVFSTNTMLAKDFERKGLAFSVNPYSIKDLEKFFTQLTKKRIMQKKKSIEELDLEQFVYNNIDL